MFKRTTLLERLFVEYNIDNLPFGIKQDKLGDVMEEYCARLLSWPYMLRKLKHNDFDLNDTDDYLFSLIIDKAEIDVCNIVKMSATRDIEHRWTGGNSKTDVLLTVEYPNEIIEIPISVKQTTVQKVAMAEFDADTIVNEVGITDPIVKSLLYKHQFDASAINFTDKEKEMLKTHLAPYARSFVRWVLSGTPKPTSDLRFPKIMVKLQMSKQDEIMGINVYDIEEYVDSVMYDKKGNLKVGGFGTGLSWTYATGSKGRKIQFKG